MVQPAKEETKMSKSIAKALAAFLCVPVLAMSGATAKAAEPKTPFTIAVFQSEGYLPDFVAKEKGFGEKSGLDISFVTPSSGSAAAQLLLAGAINGWSTDPLIIATAASRGYDIRIGGVSAPSFTYTIMTIPGKQWPDPSAPLLDRIKALKGKRIGVSGIGAGTDNALLLFLKEAGLTAQDVTRVAIGQQQAAIGQLSAGRIDAFVSFALAGNEMIKEETGAVEYISTLTEDVPASIRNTPHLAFAVSSEFANKNPKAVQGWLNAERDAIAWIRENQHEAAEILDKHIFNGKQPELARKIVPMALQSFFRNTRDDLKMPESAFELVVQEGRVVDSFKDSQEPTYQQVVLPFARIKD
jgi:ABC-type nitrate/sulfonate/bicarbonate transport system substrate-binding protein